MQIEINGAKRITVTQDRLAWALRELIAAGPRGLTAIERPAPRWAAYVKRLRDAGVPIERIVEAHQGEFPGWHARYRLAAPVRIVRGAV